MYWRVSLVAVLKVILWAVVSGGSSHLGMLWYVTWVFGSSGASAMSCSRSWRLALSKGDGSFFATSRIGVSRRAFLRLFLGAPCLRFLLTVRASVP